MVQSPAVAKLSSRDELLAQAFRIRTEVEIRELRGLPKEIADLGFESRIWRLRKGQAVAKVERICLGGCEPVADFTVRDLLRCTDVQRRRGCDDLLPRDQG